MPANHSVETPPTLIFHITTPAAWERAQSEGSYRAESLPIEGFMHCSTPAQIAATANKHYTGKHGLILLTIDTGRVTSLVRYENINADAEYPHIYGPLNLDAVISTIPYEPDANGIFQSPPEQ